MKNIHGIDILKFALVLPFFLVCYYVLSEIGGMLLGILVEEFVENEKYKFFIYHIHHDIICIFIPIFYSCILANHFKTFISAVFMFFFVMYSDAYTQISMKFKASYGIGLWKADFVKTAFIVSAVLPFVIFLFQRFKEKRIEKAVEIKRLADWENSKDEKYYI